MDPENNTAVSADELKAEQDALQEAKTEEVRANVISEYGFDEVADAERIDKLTSERVSAHQTKASLTKQKVKWRTEATKPKVTATPPVENKTVPPEDIDKRLDERLAQRDLEEMSVSDELRKEIGDWARFKGITVKQAARAPHIAAQIADYEKTQQADDAAISRTNRSSGKKNYTIDSPPDVDMSTEEGRKEWDAYKEALKKAGN